MTDRSHVRVMMHGLTDQPGDAILPLAKSWLYPPEIEVEGDAYASRGYAEEERAFILEKTGDGGDPLSIRLRAAADSPVVNPALIIEGWGDADVRLEINGKRRPRGRDFRYGFRHTLKGSDLIVWIKYRSTDPVGLRLTPVKTNSTN